MPRTGDLFEPLERDASAPEIVLDRLRSRLGDRLVRRATRAELGPLLARASWCDADADPSVPGGGAALPFRRLVPPVALVDGAAVVSGRTRRVVRIGRVERATAPWWRDGIGSVELVAWAELEGPLLALLRARVGTDCDDAWEVVAWLD